MYTKSIIQTLRIENERNSEMSVEITDEQILCGRTGHTYKTNSYKKYCHFCGFSMPLNRAVTKTDGNVVFLRRTQKTKTTPDRDLHLVYEATNRMV